MPTNENPAGANGGASERDHAATLIVPENKPSNSPRQAGSVSKRGPAELGEPLFSRERLGKSPKRLVMRTLDAMCAGEKVSTGVDKRPGTNPQPILARPDRVLP